MYGSQKNEYIFWMLKIMNLDIRKKVLKSFFEKLSNGKKKFEIRLNDEDFKDVKEGDVLILEEWDEIKKKYTGRKLRKKISYFLRTKDLNFFSQKEINEKGFIVMSLEES